MKKLLLIPFITILISCSKGVLDGKYRLISYNQDSALHFEQYFTFDGDEFRTYLIEDGKKVLEEDSLSIISYGNDNTFTHTFKDSSYTFKYSLEKDNLKLEIGGNVIYLLKQYDGSKDEAISKLEEAKKLLDLEVISQKEYDSLKAIYTPYILKP